MVSEGTDLAETTVIKDENVFVVCRRDGSLQVGEPHPLGIYLDDCRFLSGHELTVCGATPRLLVASAARGTDALHELTNPAFALPDGRVLPLQSLRIRLERRVGPGDAVAETLLVHSYARERVRLDVELALAADFVPMLVVRGLVTGWTPREPEVERLPDGVRLSAVGSDGHLRSTTVRADRPAPPGDGPGSLRFALDLPPGGAETIELRYALDDIEPGAAASARARPAGSHPSPEEWLTGRTAVVTDDELFNRVLRRSLLDVRMLHARLDGTGYPMAGLPWYATLFGRDSLICATQLLAFDPPLAAGTLRVLGRRLGRADDPARDEEPGKVLHELRVDEIARLGLTPFGRYYGTVDATPLYLCLLCDYVDWSGDLALFRELGPQVAAMLDWMAGPGDRDGDGLLDYASRAPHGLRNQGWKDSADGIVDEHGAPLEPPITLVEPQAYALRAKRGLARLYELDGDGSTARRLRDEAAALRDRLDRFWLPDAGYYAMGFGADGRPSRALASNQGHLLWGRAVAQQRAAAIRDALMSPAMFSGWGIRTLAEGEAGYNPVGYHLGTVWPHDTAMTACGLREYGFDAVFDRVFAALLEAASTADAYRLPELFAGFSRTEQLETPVPYPVACRPQAWAAGAIPSLLTCGLGLEPDAAERRLRIRRPSLPPWLGRVDVRGLRIGGAQVDLRFERAGAGDHVALTEARVTGDVEVVLDVTGSLTEADT